MIRLVVRAVLVVHAVGLELFVLTRVGGITPDVSAVLVTFCVIDLRPARVAYVIVPLAVVRAALMPGRLGFHLWLLLAAYVLMLPLRRLLFPERWQLQMVVAGVVAFAFSRVQAGVLTAGALDPVGRAWSGCLLTAVLAPGALLVLRVAYRNLVVPRAPRLRTAEP